MCPAYVPVNAGQEAGAGGGRRHAGDRSVEKISWPLPPILHVGISIRTDLQLLNSTIQP